MYPNSHLQSCFQSKLQIAAASILDAIRREDSKWSQSKATSDTYVNVEHNATIISLYAGTPTGDMLETCLMLLPLEAIQYDFFASDTLNVANLDNQIRKINSDADGSAPVKVVSIALFTSPDAVHRNFIYCVDENRK